MGEFQDDRESELNELPAGIGKERGERVGYETEGSRLTDFRQGLYGRPDTGGQPPIDIRQQNQIAERPSEVGSVPLGFDVTSTYDARPVNARDFLETFQLEFVLNGCALSHTEEAFYDIPNGFVAVTRGFRYFTDPIIISPVPDNGITFTLIADSIAVPNYTEVLMPYDEPNFVPCYALTNPTKRIGIRITYPNTGGQQGTVNMTVQLYGNLLLSRGLPVQYEPTNRTA